MVRSESDGRGLEEPARMVLYASVLSPSLHSGWPAVSLPGSSAPGNALPAAPAENCC